MTMPDDMVLRCSTILFREETVLLVHRTSAGLDDWVLPGGTPRMGESMAACARREMREETGIAVEPSRVAFVLEAVDPDTRQRTVDLVFAADGSAHGQSPASRETGMEPEFVSFGRLRGLDLKPPLAGHLPGFHDRGARRYAPYLGNLWRPDDRSRVRRATTGFLRRAARPAPELD